MRIGGCGLLAAGSELFRWFRLKVLWMLLCVLPSQGRSWVCSRLGTETLHSLLKGEQH